MSRHPMNQMELEEALNAAQDRLEDLLEAFRESVLLAAESEAKFKSAHAGAYLRRSGPVKERDAYADHVCESELQAFLVSAAVVKYTKAAMDACNRDQDRIRTLLANLRGLVTSGFG